ncbi:hypothetical protein HMPREF3223_00669 [Cutibacterium avidum]|nr:hypothetical protein HMPREF3223_00669 [Cutibacterium avidum]
MVSQCQAEPIDLRGSLGNDAESLLGMIHGQDTQSHETLLNHAVPTNPSSREPFVALDNCPMNGLSTK